MAEPTKPDVAKSDNIRAPQTDKKGQEIPEADLNKVTGGALKSGDPCDGGNFHRG